MQHNNDAAPQRSAHPQDVNEIIARLASDGFAPPSTDIELDSPSTIKLPLTELAAFGAGFASLAERFHTASTPGNLFFATDALGNALDGSTFQLFNDGSGLMGSARDAAKGFSQIRFHKADGSALSAGVVMPIDPTALFAAAALAQINHKLDAIQKTQEEMFEYLRQKDKSVTLGDLQTLSDLLKDYRFNWDNDVWLKNSHMKTMDIRQEMEQSITHLRAQISGKLHARKPLESRMSVRRRLGEVTERMKDYQRSLYVYSFASFLEPLLSGNLGEEYLSSAAQHIDDHSMRYREMYTDCYNAVEDHADRSIDAAVLGVVSFVGTKLGEAVASTPIGKHTLIDEALMGAGESINQFNEDWTDKPMGRLRDAKSPNVAPFSQSVRALNQLHNSPLRLAADSENLYLMPVSTGRDN